MKIPIAIDPAITQAAPAFECPECDRACGFLPSSECAIGSGQVWRRYPGTAVFVLTLYGGFIYEMELDLERNRGRLCRQYGIDTPSCGTKEPVCAVAGTISLSKKPAGRLDDVAVSFAVTLEDGMALRGAF